MECYPLTVQSGHGHDLNVSLFERLVTSGFPHVTLGVQHRMHPDISRLVRPTYPSLEDHASVLRHPGVMGLSQRVVFVAHDQAEVSEGKQQGMWGAHAAHQSKVGGSKACKTMC